MSEQQQEARELMESVRAAELSMEASRRVYEHAAARLMQAICPYRIGDLVEIHGESYRGKTGLVKAIRIVPYLGKYEWQCELVVLKACGQESAHRTQVRQHAKRETTNGDASQVKLATQD